MPRRAVTRMFVVNPPGLGAARRRVFERQFRGWPRPPPPISYTGINKNYLDLGGGSKYRHLIQDDRSPLVRLKLRLGWEKHAEDFRQRYDPILTTADWVSAVLPIGHLACSLSHMEVWRMCGKEPDDSLCMVVEDDALINPAIEFDGIEWPEAADVLQLWSGQIRIYEGYSDRYVKMIPEWQSNSCNWGTLGYIITPACARRFLSELVPYIVNRTVDLEIWYRGAPDTSFGVRKPWVRPIHTERLAEGSMPGLRSLVRRAFYCVRGLFPASFRERHPFWLQKQERQFEEPQLEDAPRGKRFVIRSDAARARLSQCPRRRTHGVIRLIRGGWRRNRPGTRRFDHNPTAGKR